MLQNQCLGNLAIAGNVEEDIGNSGVEVELNTMPLQILHHRKYHGLILVILGEAQGRKIGQAADMVDIPLHIPFHFKSTLIILECKHGAPVHPEIGVKHILVEDVGHFDIVQSFIRGHEELHDLHAALVGQTEFLIRVGILAAVLRRAAQRVVGILLIQPVVLVQNTDPFRFNGRDGAEQIPHTLKVIVHFTTAAHDITYIRDVISVQTAARYRRFFQYMDMGAGHLTIAYEEARCS